MFIDGIGISGYRSFGSRLQKIGPFGKINLFIGQNNSGKSNILYESIVLEHSGVAVAAVVPIDEYRKWHPESKTTEAEAEPDASLSYKLPEDLLLAYHRLADKKFDTGLTPDEEAELALAIPRSGLTSSPAFLGLSALCTPV